MSTTDNTRTDSMADAMRKSEFPVTPGQYYRFRIDATDEAGREGPRGLIGKLEFLDASGSRLNVKPEGSAHTDRHGAVVYLPTHCLGTPVLTSENLVMAPERAHRLRMQVRNWKCSPDVVIHSPVELVDEREPALNQYEFPLQAGLPHVLEIALRGVKRDARAGILALEFVDGAGAVIPAPYDECISSPRFGAFRYLRATTGGESTRIPVYPPVNAALVRLAVYPWRSEADGLAVVDQPRLALDVPEGLDIAEWSLLSAREWGVAHHLSIGHGGLVHIALDCLGIGQRPGPDPVVLVDFVDDAGKSIADCREGDSESQPAIVIATPLSVARRGGFFRRPGGAVAVRFRLAAGSSYGLLVRNAIHVLEVPAERLPDRILTPLDSGRSLVLRQAVSSLWSAHIEFEGLATDSDSHPLEVAVTLLDAADKPVNPKGILRKAANANVTVKGNVLSVVPHSLPSGTQGVVRYGASVSILPPRGATTLSTIIENTRSQGVVVAASVRPYEAIVGERIVPESVPEILAMDESSPDKVCELADAYMRRHGTDSGVLTHVLDAYRRYGELEKLEAVARKALALRGTTLAKLHTKARHALALIQELDIHWLPDSGLAASLPNSPSGSPGLRIAHLFKTTVPVENTGGAIRCLNIVNFQQRIGMKPLVVTPLGYPDTGGSGQQWEWELIDGIPYFRLNGVGRQALRGVTSTTQLQFTAMLTANLLGEQGIDILQASSGYRGYEQALVGLAVARALRVPFVYEVRSYHEHTWRELTDWLLDAEHTKRRIEQENRCMREADAVVTICETMKQGLVERGVPAEKVFVVPNSVDLGKFPMAEPSPDLRARLGLGSDLVAGYISNVSEREGHDVLLRAVARARASGVGLKCLIVGAGLRLQRLRALATQLGIAEHVVFTGEVPHDQIPSYYALIDIFVVPRVRDFASDFVTPMKPFEAMAMGRALVVSDRPALLEIVGEGGERGAIFRAGDDRDLAGNLVRLAGSPEARQELARQGRRWIEAERSWDKTIRIYDQVYAYAQNVKAGMAE